MSIRESCNLIEHEAHMVTLNQRYWYSDTQILKSQILVSFDDHLHAKNIRYQMITSTDVDDQRILQSDLTRGTTGHSQPKVVVVSDTNFPW